MSTLSSCHTSETTARGRPGGDSGNGRGPGHESVRANDVEQYV